VLASANPKKVAEIRWVLGDAVDLVARPADIPDVVEDADTFVGNARLKAVAIADVTGEPALADDSGLVVDALDGAPGVRSARYAGDAHDDAANVAKLLAALDGVPPEQRTARFVAVAMVRWPDGREIVAEGTVEGHIIDEVRGNDGFGYDPVFVPVDRDDGLTFAELPREAKHAISHRGRSLRALLTRLTPPV
jgi:XTP/dITP diphosphohydrolase